MRIAACSLSHGAGRLVITGVEFLQLLHFTPYPRILDTQDLGALIWGGDYTADTVFPSCRWGSLVTGHSDAGTVTCKHRKLGEKGGPFVLTVSSLEVRRRVRYTPEKGSRSPRDKNWNSFLSLYLSLSLYTHKPCTSPFVMSQHKQIVRCMSREWCWI